MTRPLEWFRDEDGGWTVPDGRRGELFALVVGLPIFAWFVDVEVGFPAAIDRWPIVLAGVVCGFLYATYYREAALEALPEDLNAWTVVSLFAGGLGLSLLELLPATDGAVTFLLVAGATIVAIYLCRLLSPFHDGVRPPRRGVDPPPAPDVDG